MKKTIRSAFIAFALLTALLSGCAPASTPTPPTLTPSSVPPTSTPNPTATATLTPTLSPTPKPTKYQLTYNGSPCVSWTSISEKDIDARLCVYGIIFEYGPLPAKWHTILFSADPDAFRVQDFNYYYLTPLNVDDCVLVYGKIRKNGSFLMITPDRDAAGRVRTGDAALCE